MSSAGTPTSPARALWRGLTKRCSRCGHGRLFRRWFSMLADCPGCGLHFEREEGFFLGAFVINFAITEFAIMALMIVGFAMTLPDAPVGQLAALGATLSLAVPLLTYPFSKTVWTAIDMIMRKNLGESYEGRESQPGFRSRERAHRG